MIKVGSAVRVKPPFHTGFPNEYVVVEVVKADDGTDIFFLEGIEGGFSIVYIEEVV